MIMPSFLYLYLCKVVKKLKLTKRIIATKYESFAFSPYQKLQDDEFSYFLVTGMWGRYPTLGASRQKKITRCNGWKVVPEIVTKRIFFCPGGNGITNRNYSSEGVEDSQ